MNKKNNLEMEIKYVKVISLAVVSVVMVERVKC